ncbi:putative neural-cadherin-like [Sesbania bispinosa]|nr:putative neural-cadherin-like [Sesbania bispinosa]
MHYFKRVPQRSKPNSTTLKLQTSWPNCNNSTPRNQEQPPHTKRTAKPNGNGESDGSTSKFHKKLTKLSPLKALTSFEPRPNSAIGN